MEDKMAYVYPVRVWCRPVIIFYATGLISLPLQTVMTKIDRVSHGVRIESTLLHVCVRELLSLFNKFLIKVHGPHRYSL